MLFLIIAKTYLGMDSAYERLCQKVGQWRMPRILIPKYMCGYTVSHTLTIACLDLLLAINSVTNSFI
jgi:hypothetical protein